MEELVQKEIIEFKEKILDQEDEIKQLDVKINDKKLSKKVIDLDIQLLHEKIRIAKKSLIQIQSRVNFKREQVLSFETTAKTGKINTFLKYLSDSPLSAYKKLIEEMQTLKKNIQKDNKVTESKIQTKFVSVFYGGDSVKFRLPIKTLSFNFDDLLSDCCTFFNQPKQICILLDETYSIWPSNFQVAEQIDLDPGLKIILSYKVSKNNEKNIENSKKMEDNKSVNTQQSVEQKKDSKVKKGKQSQISIFMKQRIEKNVLKECTQLIMQLIYLIFVLIMTIYFVQVPQGYNINKLIKQKFAKTNFQRLNDDQFNYFNYNIDTVVQNMYTVKTIADINLWISKIFIKNIGLYCDQTQLEKYKNEEKDDQIQDNINNYCYLQSCVDNPYDNIYDNSKKQTIETNDCKKSLCNCEQLDTLTKYQDKLYTKKDENQKIIESRSFFGYVNQIIGKIRLIQYRANETNNDCKISESFKTQSNKFFNDNKQYTNINPKYDCIGDYVNEPPKENYDMGVLAKKPIISQEDTDFLNKYCTFNKDEGIPNASIYYTDLYKKKLMLYSLTDLKKMCKALWFFHYTIPNQIISINGKFNTYNNKNFMYADIEADQFKMIEMMNILINYKWIDKGTSGVFFTFNFVNLPKVNFANTVIGFELHNSGLIVPLIYTFTYTDYNLIFTQFFTYTSEIPYLLVQIYIYLYILYSIYSFYSHYSYNKDDIKWKFAFFADGVTYIHIATYFFQIIELAAKGYFLFNKNNSLENQFKKAQEKNEFFLIPDQMIYEAYSYTGLTFINLLLAIIQVVISIQSRTQILVGAFFKKLIRQLMAIFFIINLIGLTLSVIFCILYGEEIMDFSTLTYSFYQVLNYLIGFQYSIQNLKEMRPQLTPIIFTIINIFVFIPINTLISTIFIAVYEKVRITFQYYQAVVPELTQEESDIKLKEEFQAIVQSKFKSIKRYFISKFIKKLD